MYRIATIDTGVQGLGINVLCPGQGELAGRTDPPHGVVLTLVDGIKMLDGSTQFQITADALAEIGRYFLAAAVHCGQDIT